MATKPRNSLRKWQKKSQEKKLGNVWMRDDQREDRSTRKRQCPPLFFFLFFCHCDIWELWIRYSLLKLDAGRILCPAPSQIVRRALTSEGGRHVEFSHLTRTTYCVNFGHKSSQSYVLLLYWEKLQVSFCASLAALLDSNNVVLLDEMEWKSQPAEN